MPDNSPRQDVGAILVCLTLLILGLARAVLPALGASGAPRSSLDDPPLLGPSFPIATAPGYQESAALVYNTTAHEYLVVWDDARSGVGNSDIYGQRVSPAGSLLGENFAICTAGGGQLSPALAWNAADNEYLVVWTDAGAFDIYAQRVAADGEEIGSSFAVSTAPNQQQNATVAWNAALDEYLVVWADSRNDAAGSTPDLYGQRVEADGSLPGSEIVISAAPNAQNSPELVWNPSSGEYLVAWGDARPNPTIYARRLTGTGNPVGAEIIIPGGGSAGYSPAIAWSASANEYLVVWTEDLGGPGTHNIRGHRVAGDGTLLGNTVPITDGP